MYPLRPPSSTMSKRRRIFSIGPLPVHALFVHLLFLSILSIFLFSSSFTTSRSHSSSYIPVSATLPHIIRPRKPVENDWTAPAILTALATSTYESKSQSHDDVNLLIFTTGISASGRLLRVKACVVGKRFFSVTGYLRSVTVCRVPKSALLPLTKHRTSKESRPMLSVLLQDDVSLRSALRDEISIENQTSSPLYPYITRVHYPNKSFDSGYVVKSSLTFHPSMLQTSRGSNPSGFNNPTASTSKPPFGLCLMTAMRMYPYLISPFFAYYRRLGVDRFFLYDNMCEHDLKIHEGPDVEVIYWPWARSQTQSFTHFLHAARGRCQWVAFFDADEYAFVGPEEQTSHVGLLKKYIDLRWKQGYGQVAFPFIRMRNVEHIKIPSGNIPELYTMRDTLVPFNGVGKVIVSMECPWGEHKVHYVKGWNSVDYKRGSDCETYRNVTMDLNPTRLMDNAQLVHYTWRSWEEYRLKHLFGTASAFNGNRPRKDLGKSPPNWFLKISEVENYTTFRDYWRRVMKK